MLSRILIVVLISCISTPVRAVDCSSCGAIGVQGAAAAQYQSASLGTFQLVPGVTAGGRAVYQNENSQYLYYYAPYTVERAVKREVNIICMLCAYLSASFLF